MDSDYDRIAAAIRFIERQWPTQPSLGAIAAELGLSPFHFQRLFRRWAGVSPKRFLQCLTVEYAKALLDRSESVLETAFEVGLSSPARLHDHFVAFEAVTPGEYKRRGAGMHIRFGGHESPFGPVLIAVTGRGICWLSFIEGESDEADLTALRRFWQGAAFSADQTGTRSVVERVFAWHKGTEKPLRVLVAGTNFQIKVWQALLRIPFGLLSTYGDVARAIGRPSASRAVGRALTANPVAYLIPCHRVILRVGECGGYRWGSIRKQALIAWESSMDAPVSRSDEACLRDSG